MAPSVPPRSEEHTSELQSHRDLHSFPTRRSSDLQRTRNPDQPPDRPPDPPAVPRRFLQRRARGHPHRVAEPRSRCRHRRPDRHLGCPVRVGHSLQWPHRCRQDRKSTRLNSSHTEIYTLSLHDALPISSELETLTSRLIDRPIRPLFPEGFYNDVHVVIHTVSLNPEVDADIAALIATSAALSVSGIPFNGPIGAARVGFINGEYVLNPGQTQRKDSQMDLVVAGTEAAVLMVESEAQQLPEDVMLGAVVFGHEQGRIAIDAIHELVREAGKPVWDWVAPAKDEELIAKVAALGDEALRTAYQIRNKQSRTQACREAYAAVKAGLTAQGVEFDGVKVEGMLFDIEARIVRSQILAGEP